MMAQALRESGGPVLPFQKCDHDQKSAGLGYFIIIYLGSYVPVIVYRILYIMDMPMHWERILLLSVVRTISCSSSRRRTENEKVKKKEEEASSRDDLR